MDMYIEKFNGGRYGLPQAGVIKDNFLKKCSVPHG